MKNYFSISQAAEKDYGVSPKFSVQIIVLSGILQWNYQAQVFIGNGRNSTQRRLNSTEREC